MTSIEFDLMRLTAQSSGPNPKEPGGGKPNYSVAELRACLAEVPHLAWHCLLAKYHQDQHSEHHLLAEAQRLSMKEWFTNPAHRLKTIQAGQLTKVAELAVLCYLLPSLPHNTNYTSRAAFCECDHRKWRSTFQDHFNWLINELAYNERIGEKAYKLRKYGENPRFG